MDEAEYIDSTSMSDGTSLTEIQRSTRTSHRKRFLLFSSLALLVSCILLLTHHGIQKTNRNLQSTNQYFWYFNSAVTRFSPLTYNDDEIDEETSSTNNEVKVPKSIKIIEKTKYDFTSPETESYNSPNIYDLNVFEETKAPTDAPTNSPTTKPNTKHFTFYVMGDIPYSDAEKEQLKTQLNDLPYDGDFIVHVGDLFKTKRTKCNLKGYEDTRDILRDYSNIPVFVLPGDNDWKDCPKPQRSLNTWFDHFEEFEQHWAPLPFTVNRERKAYFKDDETNEKVEYQSEYFSFVHKNVLFIGVHILGGSIFDQMEWEARHEEMLIWTVQNIGLYTNDHLHAIVIFGHAGPVKDLKNDDYFDPLVQLHEDYIKNIPIIYIHGNGHRYRLYKPFDSDTMKSLQVDQGAIASPLRVTINPDGGNIDQYSYHTYKPGVQTFMNFEFDRRL